MRIIFAALVATLAAAPAALASPVIVPPTSYAMANGDGQATGGTFNYWDLAYSGAGATNVDRAPLSGGLGDLTDGILSPGHWNTVENVAGTGPYVGWRNFNPVITFTFGGPVDLTSVTLFFDDADNIGSVAIPLSVTVRSGAFIHVHPVNDPPTFLPASPVLIDITGIGPTSSVEIEITRRNQWIFLTEVVFEYDPGDVPAPAALALFGLGLAAIGLRRRG